MSFSPEVKWEFSASANTSQIVEKEEERKWKCMFKKKDAEGKGSYDRLNQRERKVNGSEKMSLCKAFQKSDHLINTNMMFLLLSYHFKAICKMF